MHYLTYARGLLYKKKCDYKKALFHFEKYSGIKDSLFTKEKSKEIGKLEAQHEFEKKESEIQAEHEKQIAISEEEKKRQKLFIFFIGSLTIALAIIAVIIFRSLRFTRTQKIIIERHQKDIIDSITYAKKLQEAILPPVELIKKHLPESFIFYKPKDIVAGDFYWMEFVDNIVFIAAADCTGHGVPGALVSVVCSNALNRAVKEFGFRDTGKILDKVTDLVLETFEKSNSEVKDGMDISLLSYNKTSNQIQWSGANNPLWYFQGGKKNEIKADKQPIGKYYFRKSFNAHTIEYSDNSMFYLFTDGLPDQFGGPRGKKLLYSRFKETLISISHLPMKEQEEKLEKAFCDWKGNFDQVDDISVIGIKL